MKTGNDSSAIALADDKELIRAYAADFENACDYLYYGIGYKSWRETCSITDDKTAKRIWRLAHDKMSRED